MARFETVQVGIDEPIGRIILNRPERLNALSPQMIDELTEAVQEVDRDDRVRAVVLAGAGRVFSTGFDLNHWPRGRLREPAAEMAARGRSLEEAVRRMRPVTVAAVHGSVIGGGVVLALACDLRVAAEDAIFAIPEVELGVPFSWFGVELVVREVGPAIAKELVITGRPFTAQEAHGWGMLNQVVPADHLATEAEALARLVASRSRVVAEFTKKQVEAMTRIRAGGGGDVSGGLGLVGAVTDPDSARAAEAYLGQLGRKSR